MSCNQFWLVEFGGDVELMRDWAYSILKWMLFVKRKATMAMSKMSVVDFQQLKGNFLADDMATTEMEEFPAELILNWDQTGINIVPSSTWSMDCQGSKLVKIAGAHDKRQITAVFRFP